MFDMLPIDCICEIVVMLNDGVVGNAVIPEYGYLHPGFVQGRELHYFKISRDAMTFWKHVCMYLRHNYRFANKVDTLLLFNHPLVIEMWTDPYEDQNGSAYYDFFEGVERYVPRHLYAGDPKPWMKQLCSGPQTEEESKYKCPKKMLKQYRKFLAAGNTTADWLDRLEIKKLEAKARRAQRAS